MSHSTMRSSMPTSRPSAHAAYCPLSGLPRLHGTRVDNIPAPARYLAPDLARAEEWKRRLDEAIPAGLIDWFREATNELVTAFEGIEPEEAVWHWSGDNRAITLGER